MEAANRPCTRAMKSLLRITVIAVGSLLILLLLFFQWKWSGSTLRLTETGPGAGAGGGSGFVLSLLFYEQIGNGASNIMNLQCWAGSLQMTVVEPFIRESRDSGDQVFFFDLLDSSKSPPRYRDLFDIHQWNRYSIKHGFAPLASIEDFLTKASRGIILVTIIYSGSSKCPKEREVSQDTLIRFEYHNFIVVRKVCINLLHEGRLRTRQEFNELIFGELLGKSNVTVVFDEWRGIRNESEREGKIEWVDVKSEWHRILIKDSPCWYDSLALQPYYVTWAFLENKNTEHTEQLVDTAVLKESKLGLIPSKQVLANVDAFRGKHFENNPYLAIKARMEKYEITDQSLHAKCVKKIASFKKYALDEYKLTQTFFASDVGKYGSNSWSWPQGNPGLSEELYRDIINVLGTSSDQEDAISREFETVTHSTGRVSIAWTQGTIVAEARCIIFLGGGAFHALILNLHSALYRGNECFVYLDEHCNEHAKLGFH